MTSPSGGTSREISAPAPFWWSLPRPLRVLLSSSFFFVIAFLIAPTVVVAGPYRGLVSFVAFLVPFNIYLFADDLLDKKQLKRQLRLHVCDVVSREVDVSPPPVEWTYRYIERSNSIWKVAAALDAVKEEMRARQYAVKLELHRQGAIAGDVLAEVERSGVDGRRSFVDSDPPTKTAERSGLVVFSRTDGERVVSALR